MGRDTALVGLSKTVKACKGRESDRFSAGDEEHGATYADRRSRVFRGEIDV
jgi:hypothetical protein